MNKKIIGVTVGTPMNPKTIIEKTIAEWARQPTKPTYTAEEIGAAEKTKLNILSEQVADLQYTVVGAIDITSMTNSVGTVELGRTITDATVSWTINKQPVSQKLDGVELDPSERSKAFSGLSITANKTFTLNVTDERGATDSGSTTIKFVNGLFWGTVADKTEIDSALMISALTKSLKETRGCSFTLNPPTDMRMVFALPKRLGTPTFTSNGFPAAFYKEKTFAFTNHLGYTEDYDVWLSNQLVNNSNGSIPIVVS